jgi:hypothetical protein
MAAWTWMRYSYCWSFSRFEDHGPVWQQGRWPDGVFAEDRTSVLRRRGRVKATVYGCHLARGSRLHPASVSGLVVAAMGVFVFGLYLRRWAKERRAKE